MRPEWLESYLYLLRNLAGIAIYIGGLVLLGIAPTYVMLNVWRWDPLASMGVMALLFLFAYLPLLMWASEKGWTRKIGSFFFYDRRYKR